MSGTAYRTDVSEIILPNGRLPNERVPSWCQHPRIRITHAYDRLVMADNGKSIASKGTSEQFEHAKRLTLGHERLHVFSPKHGSSVDVQLARICPGRPFPQRRPQLLSKTETK